ncbi:MAG: DUF2953 domain-containing protein [Clostridiales bacterium]|nr:DUF2953 domain-containing protein [Clostridiales bacterium]
MDYIKELFKPKKNYFNIIIYIKEKIQIKDIYWETEIGIDDAADTAILSGLLWIIKSNSVVFLENKYFIENIHIDIKPYHSGIKFNMIFNCIGTLKLVNIIVVGIKYIAIKIRGGEIIERASN